MDWVLAVRINRGELLRIMATLFAMMPDRAVETLPRHLHLTILRILRPAESIARRLIAVAAVGLSVAPAVPRGSPVASISSGKGQREPVFRLFDPRKYAGLPRKKVAQGVGPQVVVIGLDRPIFEEKQDISPDDLVSAVRLRRRLDALQAAADDIPKQAARLARMLARGRSKYARVMRPGRPPGYRAPRASGRWRHPVDELLDECQRLALWALRPVPDP